MAAIDRARIDINDIVWVEFEEGLAKVYFRGLDDEIVICQFPYEKFAEAMNSLPQERFVTLEWGPSRLRIRLYQDWVDLSIVHKSLGSIMTNLRSLPEQLFLL